MDTRDAAERLGRAPTSHDVVHSMTFPVATLSAVTWALAASTVNRIRRGEGALLAVNASLIVHAGLPPALAIASMLISLATIGAMYALNDLYDAPLDANNPKKDRRLVSIYVTHRRASSVALVVAKGATIVLSFAWLGPTPTAAVAGAMLVNLVYSTVLKGVPVIDVAWCGVWGAVYAAIVTTSPLLLVVVALMTAVCHLYQALGDRVSDAANAITTTAVRSVSLSRNVFAVLSLLTYAALRNPLGDAWAATAFVPLGIFFVVPTAHAGWVLTKAYFGVIWLVLLQAVHAAA